MALQKQPIDISFAMGLDQKVDPKRLQIGKFKELVNSVYTKQGLLTKRNGYKYLTPLTGATSLTTYKTNLVATGDALQVYNQDSQEWIDTGTLTPIDLSVVPLVRTATSQTTADVAIAPNGLACSIWFDSNGTSYYQISDAATGQIVVYQTPVAANSQQCRVFSLGSYFILTFLENAAGTHLQYIAIPIINPSNPNPPADISTVPSSVTAAYDGFVANNTLYIAYNASDGGGNIRVTSLSSILVHGITESTQFAGKSADRISVTADITGNSPVVWVTASHSSGGGSTTFSQAYTSTLIPIGSPVNSGAGVVLALDNIATSAANGVLRLYFGEDAFFPIAQAYRIQTNTLTQGGTLGTLTLLLNTVGLASKAFYLPSKDLSYVLISTDSLQPSYFLVDENANVVAKLAYSNGAGTNFTQILPGVNIISDEIVQIGYLFADQIVPVNKSQGVAKSSGVYTQTGINVATFEFGVKTSTVEIGNDLHLTGGYMSMFDGDKPVEHQFHLWPDPVTAVWSATGGSIHAQPDGSTNTNAYFYQVTYEWTDAQGNIHRSAPSVPISVTTTGTGVIGSIAVTVPYLVLTAKTDVRIILYRWSVAQQLYYQVSTVANPTINVPRGVNPTVTIIDTSSDATILGNALIYTTGGVIEDIAAPATNIFTLFKSRLFLVDAEDTNLIWFSKQVIESTPVEMSDLLTLFVAPTVGAQGSTGPITALSAMDDKLIIFKENAIYYITGNGPDNTGANNDFSDPIFITSTVGCANTQSIVLTPLGVMFQSNKGTWLLGRDLSTQYIGAPVENFNAININSALTIPGTNQIRFTLDGGGATVYDYYFNQWSEFQNMPATSATIYQGLHTYLDSFNRIGQETPGLYLDGAEPVLMNFTTGPINIAGVQGFQRVYYFYLLGTYISPHKLFIQTAYDYGPVQDSFTINPTNFSPAYGGDSVYGGGSPYGGPGNLEQWRIFPTLQKCQAFQISVQEIYDPSKGVMAGAGLTLSGINVIIGAKKGYTTIRAANSVG